jgi:hypothetical protein
VLYVLQGHRHTFELTDTLGDRRMSSYWGAARAYMPGWSRHDDPYDHPLLVGDRLGDPAIRAAMLGEWASGLAHGSNCLHPRRRPARAVTDSAPSEAATSAAAPADHRTLGVPLAGGRSEQRPEQARCAARRSARRTAG